MSLRPFWCACGGQIYRSSDVCQSCRGTIGIAGIAGREDMKIADVQVHLWEPERPDRPWGKLARPPHRPNGFSAEEMLAEMDAAGVDRAIIVPPTWAGDSNDWALAMAER